MKDLITTFFTRNWHLLLIFVGMSVAMFLLLRLQVVLREQTARTIRTLMSRDPALCLERLENNRRLKWLYRKPVLLLWKLDCYLALGEDGKARYTIEQLRKAKLEPMDKLELYQKEISFFAVTGDEKNLLLSEGKYLKNETGAGCDITRLVFLPSDSVNSPTYKVVVKSITFYSSLNKKLFFASSAYGIDCDYASDILQRGYNCICVDIAKHMGGISDLFSQASRIELRLDIISVFNVKMSTNFSIRLDQSKNVDANPDKQIIKDLKTHTIHHCNYVIEEKSILK